MKLLTITMCLALVVVSLLPSSECSLHKLKKKLREKYGGGQTCTTCQVQPVYQPAPRPQPRPCYSCQPAYHPPAPQPVCQTCSQGGSYGGHGGGYGKK
ncbi:hypothetical protein HDE_06776 [Halotydeus destructor]|nr:hypothetical protein HDE_06776 [Halotydeus destructor]